MALDVQYSEFKEDTDHLEATLAQWVRQEMGAHKVILAPSSPCFRDFLRLHRHSHPVIALRGLKPSGVDWTSLKKLGASHRGSSPPTGTYSCHRLVLYPLHTLG